MASTASSSFSAAARSEGRHNLLVAPADMSDGDYFTVIADDVLEEARMVRPKSAGAKCQVLGCTSDLRKEEKPAYCCKRRLCREHMRAPAVQKDGYGDQLWRFCFQCGKLEPIANFEGDKRTCTVRLHQRRRIQRNSSFSNGVTPASHLSHHLTDATFTGTRHEGDPADDLGFFSMQQQQQHFLAQHHHQQQAHLLHPFDPATASNSALPHSQPVSPCDSSQPAQSSWQCGLSAAPAAHHRAPKRSKTCCDFSGLVHGGSQVERPLMTALPHQGASAPLAGPTCNPGPLVDFDALLEEFLTAQLDDHTLSAAEAGVQCCAAGTLVSASADQPPVLVGSAADVPVNPSCHLLLQEPQCHNSQVAGQPGALPAQADVQRAQAQQHRDMQRVAVDDDADALKELWPLQSSPQRPAAVTGRPLLMIPTDARLPEPLQQGTWQQQQQQQVGGAAKQGIRLQQLRAAHLQQAAAPGVTAAADVDIRLLSDSLYIGGQLQVQPGTAATDAGPVFQQPTELMPAAGTAMLEVSDLSLPQGPGVGSSCAVAHAHPAATAAAPRSTIGATLGSAATQATGQASGCGLCGVGQMAGVTQQQQQHQQQQQRHQQQKLQQVVSVQRQHLQHTAARLQQELSSIHTLLAAAGSGCAAHAAAHSAAPTAAANPTGLSPPLMTAHQVAPHYVNRAQQLLQQQTDVGIVLPAAYQEPQPQQQEMDQVALTVMLAEAREMKLQMLLEQSHQQMESLRMAWAALQDLSS